MAGARVDFVADGADEFLGIRVDVEHARGAVGDFIRLLATAVRRGEDERKIAREVLDVLMASEGCVCGKGVARDEEERSERNKKSGVKEGAMGLHGTVLFHIAKPRVEGEMCAGPKSGPALHPKYRGFRPNSVAVEMFSLFVSRRASRLSPQAHHPNRREDDNPIA